MDILTATWAAANRDRLRTLPDRFSDVKNILEYEGIDPTGSTDSSAAIIAAIEDTSGNHSSTDRGLIDFGRGTYRVDEPIPFEASSGIQRIGFIGQGARFNANFDDAIFRRDPDAIIGPVGGPIWFKGLQFYNSHATGKGLACHCTIGSKIELCAFNAYIGVETYNSQSITVSECGAFRPGGATIAGSVGIMAGNATQVFNCDCTAFEHGIRHSNAGITVLGGRFEVNNGTDDAAAIVIGRDSDNNVFQTSGFTIAGQSMESNRCAIHVVAGSGGLINCSAGASGVHVIDWGLRLSGGNDNVVMASTFSSQEGYNEAGIYAAGTRISMMSVSTNGAWSVPGGVDTSSWFNTNYVP